MTLTWPKIPFCKVTCEGENAEKKIVLYVHHLLCKFRRVAGVLGHQIVGARV
jgi:hypothetical protein